VQPVWRKNKGNVPIMEAKMLRLVSDRATRPIVAAPPAIILSKQGREYLCGYCRTLLLVAQAGELRDGLILCKNCHRHNEQP
jgi:hypothetical protein